MIGLRRALCGIGLFAAVLIAAEFAIVLSSDHNTSPVADAIIIGVVIASWVGTGLYAWWRRPQSRIGALMVWVGCLFFFQALTSSDSRLIFTLGLLFSSACLAAAVHMLLAFPTGRIERAVERRLVAGLYALAVLAPLLIVLFRSDCDCGDDAGVPKPLLTIHDDRTIADAIEVIASVVGVGLTVAIAVVLVKRWRRAAPSGRRELAPVMWTGAVLAGAIALTLALDRPGDETTAARVASLGMLLAFAAIPFAFLAGLARSRAWRVGALFDVVESLGAAGDDEHMAGALAEAVGDPSLQVVYWLPEREIYVDLTGRRVELPAEGGARVSTPV